MALRRKKGGAQEEAAQPPADPFQDGPPATEYLPVLHDEGTTTDREATRRLKQAEADLKKLEKRERKARKAEVRRQRAIGRRLARIEVSRERRPYTLVSFLIVANGIAAAFAVILLLYPDWPLYDPVIYADSAHWEMIAIAFVAGGVGSVLLLAGNPSREYQDRARMSFYAYFGVGLCITFTGALLALVLEPLQDWGMDWEQALMVLTLVSAGAAITVLVVHFGSRSGGSRWFLSGRYHQVMGFTTAVLVVSLILLGLMFLASEDLMFDIGLAIMVAGGLAMMFPLPVLVASFSIERFEDAGVIAALAVLIAMVLILLVLSGWMLDEYLPELAS